MCHTTSTILPPPSDFPVPLPDLAPTEPDSGQWRALVEITRDTVRPGSHSGLRDLPEGLLEDDVAVDAEAYPLEGEGRRFDGGVFDVSAEAQVRDHA